MLQEILKDIQYSSHVWSHKIGRMQTPCVQQSKQSWQVDALGMGRDIPCSVLSNYSLGATTYSSNLCNFCASNQDTLPDQNKTKSRPYLNHTFGFGISSDAKRAGARDSVAGQRAYN
jgi:hypothetical protein